MECVKYYFFFLLINCPKITMVFGLQKKYICNSLNECCDWQSEPIDVEFLLDILFLIFIRLTNKVNRVEMFETKHFSWQMYKKNIRPESFERCTSIDSNK